jgi:hypothetical protein
LTILHDFVSDCYLEYASQGIEPGNPIDGTWERCHHPLPKCQGGKETVWLLKCHHAAHNVLQSELFQKPCVYGWEAKFLSDDLMDLHKKWMKEKGRLVGSSNKGKSSNSWDKRKDGWKEVCSAGGKASAKARKLRGETSWGFEQMTSEERAEFGRLGGLKRAETLNNKDWKDPFDGYVGSAGTVAVHMKHHGRDPKQKVKINHSK